jgi:Fe-only nitrogenase accessory protein AnfO
MSKKIAVIVNEAEELSSFEKGSGIYIYYKDYTQWQLTEEISYCINKHMSMSDLREYVRALVLRLGDCKILIGKVLSGLAYNVFDQKGFALFEAKEVTSSLLDDVYDEVCTLKAKAALFKETPAAPVQTETDGVYYMNLIELQKTHPEISSKKALKPFLENTPFYKLEVICSHVPPWFADILPALKISYSAEELENNKFKVSLLSKVCSC